ncbi:Calx-beta domain-containing protein [Actinoplanes teichomyceticus]|uniref:Calx-beta domain-containing protein n=1 Tax=Actinoplanes teichomyceticus TaxID=1867 RepID=A0A561VSN0_ACTTI|nr:Calx-beta domain-containing protein [Actinoplanes teichomyceticus]TWG14626.1 Calx-beta domain-containing protein [Actinoplanes teichomyceticus]GIF10029.1 hypothetical protein Ate01nite_00610 [Actinoplanes teichomyceticus]
MHDHNRHAAPGGSVPLVLRGPKSVRTVLSAAVAGIIGLAPAFVASPALAQVTPQFYLTTSATPIPETDVITGTPSSPVHNYATATVSVTLTEPAGSGGVTIPWETVDRTAISTGVLAYQDYTAATGSVTIPEGETSATAPIQITILDDPLYEGTTPQYFDVQVPVSYTALQPVSTAARSARVSIADNDPVPTVSIGDASPASENSVLAFPLTLSGRSETAVTVSVTTANGPASANANPATAGSDYTPLNASAVNIPARSLNGLALVTTLADSVFEGTETVSATISGPLGATLGTPTTATGRITDAQSAPIPTVSASAQTPAVYTFAEGASGETNAAITITLPAAQTVPVRIDYAITGGTATAGVDYRATNSSLTIAPGQTTATIPVTIIGDTVYEPGGETFTLALTSPNGSIGTFTPQTFTITEAGDDVAPAWTVEDVSIAEGSTGTTTARIPIRLSGPTNADVTFSMPLTPVTLEETGTNAPGTYGQDDYNNPASNDVTITAGSTVGYLDVPINADTVFETDETATVAPTVSVGGSNVASAVAPGGQHTATLTVRNDDAAPTITFNQTSGSEGTTLRLNGTVVGVAEAAYTLGLTYVGTGANAATATQDFTVSTSPTPQTTVTATAGAAAPTLNVPLAEVYLEPDNVDEPTETFGVVVTETTGSPIGIGSTTGVFRINDDPGDLPPSASIAETASVDEPASTVSVPVTLTFNGETTSTQQTVTVPYYTVDRTATAGSDYVATRGTLSLQPGTTTANVSVPIINDRTAEGDETFEVRLGTPGPTGATVTQGTAVVTIRSEDVAPAPTAPTITSAPASVAVGRTATITGSAGNNATVELWRAPATGGSFTRVATATPNNAGNYSFVQTLNTGYRFQVRAGARVSGTRLIQVVPALAITATSRATGAATVTVTGNPRFAGQAVTIQRLVGGRWVRAASGTTNASGVYTATVTQLGAGSTQSFRAVSAAYAARGVLAGTSATVRLRVR